MVKRELRPAEITLPTNFLTSSSVTALLAKRKC